MVVRGFRFVTQCAWCKRVAWPVDAPTEQQAWTDPAELERRGGTVHGPISHGICENCESIVTGDHSA